MIPIICDQIKEMRILIKDLRDTCCVDDEPQGWSGNSKLCLGDVISPPCVTGVFFKQCLKLCSAPFRK